MTKLLLTITMQVDLNGEDANTLEGMWETDTVPFLVANGMLTGNTYAELVSYHAEARLQEEPDADSE
jgi:hypothetical protein